MKIRTFLMLLFALVMFLPTTGCGKKKQAVKKDYGKPTWLKVDEAKFAKLSEDATELEGATITVYDPEGWERQPRGAAKPPKGFKSVIVFKKDNATIMMTKSQDAKGLPDLDEENVEEFADGAQQKFKSPVKMVKLGNKVGVFFSRRVADAQRLSKFYERRIVATTIHGGLFTYELISDGKINDTLLNALYAVISKTQFVGSEAEDSAAEPAEEKKPTEVAAAEPTVEPKEEPKAEPKPETKPEPTETASKPAAEEKPVAEKPTTEVAAVAKAEEKSEPTAKPAAKKAEKKPAKKGNTKDILNELDALLN